MFPIPIVYISSDIGFTNIVVRLMGQSGVKMKYVVSTVRGQCTPIGLVLELDLGHFQRSITE